MGPGGEAEGLNRDNSIMHLKYKKKAGGYRQMEEMDKVAELIITCSNSANDPHSAHTIPVACLQ